MAGGQGMAFNPEVHHRGSIRLKGHDYSRAGAYFITICVKNRECLFGDIVNREMRLNDVGRMVQTVWDEIPKCYPGINNDVFQIMPNHVHAVVIVGAGPCACPVSDIGRPREIGQPQGIGQPRGVAPTLSLPDVVHRFKTMTTKRYIDGVKYYNWPMFPGKLWQRNYYEHIVRNENELKQIQEYILKNPAMWETDLENPVVWEKTKNIG